MSTPNPNIPNDKEPMGTLAWRRFFRAVLSRSPVSGSAVFDAATTVAVTLNPGLPDEQYNVLLDIPQDTRFWVTNKSASGFTLNADTSISATLGYTIARR